MARRRTQTGPDLFTLRCATCGAYLRRTESGYLACPNGHGKLHVDTGTTADPATEPDPHDLWARAEQPCD
jgi:hypothetical protein